MDGDLHCAVCGQPKFMHHPTCPRAASATTPAAAAPDMTECPPAEPQPCKRCHGDGYTNDGDPEIGNAYFTCTRCNGTGRAGASDAPREDGDGVQDTKGGSDAK